MADFRKLILVLAIVALVAIPASAQGLQCTSVDSVNSLLRAEGITELVGDTILRGCTNTTTPQVSIQAILGPSGANDTNRVIATTPRRTVNAYVIVGEADGTNTVYGPALISADNTTLTWESIQVPTADSSAPFSITITNIRVNAQALPLNTEVTENISVAGTSVAPLPTSRVVVGTVARGLTFTASGERSFPACLEHNSTVNDSTAADFTISFSEGFANAFKTESDATDNQAMEYNPTLVAVGSGVQGVTQGTELMATFTNIPAGVDIYVSAAPISGSLSTEIAGETSGYVKLSVSGGTATAIWEVMGGANQAALQTADFGVVVSIPQGGIVVPGTGATAPIVVSGSFAPLSTVYVPAGSSTPIPRFVDRYPASNQTQVTITACVTNLLFPYIVNTGNFDTGIAIVNTSDSNFTKNTAPANQPFNTVAQTGTCTMYFFGANAPSAPVVTPQIGVDTNSSDPINKHYYAFSLSDKVPGFLGYMIARCNFQFGHGYAFISDLGVTNWAQGYLALVIPDLSASEGATERTPTPFPLSGGGTGEQLGF